MADQTTSQMAYTISGDVIVDEVSLSQKGGSLTATLKRPLRVGLNVSSGHFSGALMEFGEGAACVLMAPSEDVSEKSKPREMPRFRVTRVSPQRFVVDVVDDQAPVINAITEAALTILQEQIKAGTRNILSAEESAQMFNKLRAKSTEQKSHLEGLVQSQ